MNEQFFKLELNQHMADLDELLNRHGAKHWNAVILTWDPKIENAFVVVARRPDDLKRLRALLDNSELADAVQ